MFYYCDRYGLGADGVLYLEDSRYVLTEFKFGPLGIEEGAKHFNEIERLVGVRNKNGK